MKTYIIASIFLLAGTIVNAQERDLPYYIEQARENSPLINKNRNDKEIIKLDLRQMNSILSKPEINLISGFMFAPIIRHDDSSTRFELVSDGATDYTGYDLAITDGGQYQAMVSLKQPLLGGSKYKTYASKADVSNQINDNNIALTIHELEQAVGYQYILCLKAGKLADNSLSLLRIVEEQVQIMQKLVEQAIYKQTDLMIMQIEVRNYYSEYVMAQAEYSASMYDLNLICGISDTGKVSLQDINLKVSSENINTSGFQNSFKLDSLNILADQAISELKYKPQLDLFADAGLNAAYLPYLNRVGFSTGISFSWNIFDGNQRNIEREKSAINLHTVEFEKQNFMTRNEVSKNRILSQLNAVDRRIIIAGQQADQYRSLYAAYARELAQGEVSVMDFKNLLKDISAKKQELLQLEMEKQLLINSYNYLNY